MIKRLIFDVDGTLITGIDFVSSVERTLKRINLYSNENVNKFLNAIETYEDKYDNYNKNDYLIYFSDCLETKLTDNFIDIFFDELKNCIPSKNQNLINTISELAREYELVLLTNYFKKSQLNRLNNIGIGKFFNECYGEELIKPNKMAYINACGRNKPNECIMIGDDLTLDVKCALKFGLHTIFVNSKNILVDDNRIIEVKSVEEISKELIEELIDIKE